jgi:broad specificity phosphatase PhoE
MDFSLYKKLDPTATHILLCRHAERYEITDFTRSTEALLTARGKKDAFRLGRRLAGRFENKTVFHSPVRRCAQTAEELIRGLQHRRDGVTPGGPLSWLGGDFMKIETAYVNDYMAVHGWQTFLRRWFDGELPAERIQPLNAAAPVELGLLQAQLAAQAGLVIDVTHDWNMMLLLEHYFGLRFETEGLPGYLEGMLISPAPAGRLRLAYRGRTREIDARG